MEHLDNKYFERAIAALKEAKAKQDIKIDEQFRESLRAKLLERAQMMEVPETPGWVDFVLGRKYLFAGAPVLAALVLVTMAALNHQVPVANDQLIRENSTDMSSEKRSDLTERSVNGDRQLQDGSQTSLQTFSSDLVMPPADVLAQREKFLKGEIAEVQMVETNGLQIQAETTTDGYTFLDNINNQLNLTTTPAGTEAASKTEPKTITPSEMAADDFAEEPESGKGSIVEETPVVIYENQEGRYIPGEASGRVEDPVEKTVPAEVTTVPAVPAPLESNGKIVVEPVYEETPVQQVMDKANVDQPTIVPDAGMQIKSLPVPVVLPSGKEALVQTESTEYLSPVEVKPVILPKVDLQYALTDVIQPQPLVASRIYYEGENRDELVKVVMAALKPRAATLSRDYYVNIVKFVDGTYRATLYEYGKAKQLLVVADQRECLKVVTEVVY